MCSAKGACLCCSHKMPHSDEPAVCTACAAMLLTRGPGLLAPFACMVSGRDMACCDTPLHAVADLDGLKAAPSLTGVKGNRLGSMEIPSGGYGDGGKGGPRGSVDFPGAGWKGARGSVDGPPGASKGGRGSVEIPAKAAFLSPR